MIYNPNQSLDFTALVDAYNKPTQSTPGAVIPVNIGTPNIYSGTAHTTPMFSGTTPQAQSTTTQYTAPVTNPGTVASITPQTNTQTTTRTNTNGVATAPSNFQVGGTVINPTTIPTTVVPGSANSAAVQAGLYQSGLTPEQQALQTQLLANQQATATQVLDPNQEYQNQLKQYQAQIDSINAMYSDRLNQARIQGQGRIESRQFAQGRAGQIGSGVGEAGVNAVQDANTQITNSIQDEQRNAIANVYAKVKSGADASLAAKTLAKQAGADKLLEYLNNVPSERKKATSSAVAELLARGVDIKNMTPEEIKSYTTGLGISNEQLKSEFDTQSSIMAADKLKKETEAKKAAADLEKTKAETSNLINKNDFEAAQKALDRALEQKKIDVEWHKAETSRIAALKKDGGTGTEKNYDAKTIPASIKKELFSDIESNANMGGTFSGTKKKTLNEFITAYPEINTDYLTALYEANK